MGNQGGGMWWVGNTYQGVFVLRKLHETDPSRLRVPRLVVPVRVEQKLGV
mgnify:CR=1 FL=1|jgi:hypothetical protein